MLRVRLEARTTDTTSRRGGGGSVSGVDGPAREQAWREISQNHPSTFDSRLLHNTSAESKAMFLSHLVRSMCDIRNTFERTRLSILFKNTLCGHPRDYAITKHDDQRTLDVTKSISTTISRHWVNWKASDRRHKSLFVKADKETTKNREAHLSATFFLLATTLKWPSQVLRRIPHERLDLVAANSVGPGEINSTIQRNYDDVLLLLLHSPSTNIHLSLHIFTKTRRFLKAERVEDFELHNAVSSDDDHSHLLVRGGRICRLV